MAPAEPRSKIINGLLASGGKLVKPGDYPLKELFLPTNQRSSGQSGRRHDRKTAARKDALLGVDDKIQEERLCSAEHLVRELREAGTK
jgi:hypothetical protein